MVMDLKAELFELGPSSRLFGMRCQQAFSALFLLDRMLDSPMGFKTVVEYGTGRGALAVFLACWAEQHSLAFHSLEKFPNGLTETKPLLQKLGHPVVEQDCQALETAEWLVANTPGPRLWVLDNGNKPLEAALVGSVAGPSDVLAMHDYGTEVGDNTIPPGWLKLEPWHGQAQELCTKFLVLGKGETWPE